MNGVTDSPGLPITKERPTWVRWRIVALLMAFSFASWFLRVSMPVAADEHIMSEYCITPSSMGDVYSAFLFVYMLGMTPGGWFIDRFGAKAALTLMGIGLGVFAALTGLVGVAFHTTLGLRAALLLVRSMMGLFATPMYPAASHTIARWVPFRERGGVNGLVQGMAALGIACTFPIFGQSMDWFGWQAAFVLTGAATVALTLLWIRTAADRPAQHPSVNEAERRLIGEGEPMRAQAPQGDWRRLLRNRSLVLLTISYAAVGYFEYLFFFWMHYYFEDVLKLDQDTSRYYAALPPLAMTLGMPLGGWLSDRLVRGVGYRAGRALVPVGALLAAAGLLYLGLLTASPAWTVTWFALALGAVGAVEGPMWATAVDLGGRHGGTAAGIFNTGGNFGGVLAPALTPRVSRWWGWQFGIGLGSVVCLLGVVLWLWIDPGERVDEES